MKLDAAIAALAQLLSSAETFIAAAKDMNALIEKARAEGRDISPAELDALAARDDSARAALEQAIKNAG